MLVDLAQFNNVQQNALMDVTGTHLIKNINTGAKSTTNFHDHAGGQFATVMNTNNLGKMNIAGLHQYDNFTNNGQVAVNPRTFNANGQRVGLIEMDEEPEELDDLAQFNQYANQIGGFTQIQGTHAFKNMSNAVGGNVVVLDHKGGQFSTFGNTSNAGKMTVSGLHQFDNTTNSGQMLVNPRGQYKLMDLATFNSMVNQATGNVQSTGTHAYKKVDNQKKGKKAGNMVFNDHKDGQAATVGALNNAGNASFSGNHAVDKTTNSGNLKAIPRAFPAKKLMDLAQFNNFGNLAGGNAQFTGTHSVKNLNNAVKGIVIFNDDKLGRFSTVGNTNNAGQMTVSGNHMFDNTTNSGQFRVIPRQFDAKGRPIKALLI